MSEYEAGRASEATSAGGYAEQFGLSSDDLAFTKGVCQALLQDVGMDGERFFAALDAGAPLGEALGLPAEILEFLYNRAHRWFSVGRPDRAESCFRVLCILDGKVADYWVGLGICLQIIGKSLLAACAFSTAASLRPLWAVPAYYSAAAALQSGDCKETKRQLERFERLSDDTTPQSIGAEARRVRMALELRLSADSSG